MPKNSSSNVLSFLEQKETAFKDKTALAMQGKYGWIEYSYNGLGLLSRKIASYLINDLNIKRKEKIAIISESRVEFGAVFFASIIAGTTFVPVDIKLTIFEIESILNDCNPEIIFVSNKFLNIAQKIKEKSASIKKIILLDEVIDSKQNEEIISIRSIPDNYTTKFRHRSLNSTALIIYTSGTTGNPKGVETTFKNILSQMEDLKIMLNEVFKEKHLSILSILPMNHLFELTFGFATFLNMGYSIYYTKSLRPKDVLNIMKDKKIKFMCTVPSFFRMLKMQFESDLAKQSKFKQALFNFNFHIMAKFLPFDFVKKFLFKDIHKQFGNEFYGFVSGGAPMDIEMGKYFYRIGINAFQGYGLSEASPVVSANLNKKINLASVGKILKSFEAKIDPESGELLVKGPAVMKGYYKREDLTREVITPDGWLKTGDLARFGKQKELYITGRIKNMIVLSGGKKVFPEEIEALLEKSTFIKEVCAFSSKKTTGEKKGTEEVGVIATPRDELKEKYSPEQIEGLIKADIKKLSVQLSQYKRPTNIKIYFGEFPKTATKKIKRKEVVELAR